MHNAINAFIYRALNDGPYFKAQIVDPKISSPKWLLCRYKESFVGTWFLSLSPGSCRGLQFPYKTPLSVINFHKNNNETTCRLLESKAFVFLTFFFK